MAPLQFPVPAFELDGGGAGLDNLVAQDGHQIISTELQKVIELDAKDREKVYIDLGEEAQGVELFEISDDESQAEDQVPETEADAQLTTQTPEPTPCSSPIVCVELPNIGLAGASLRIGSGAELKDGRFIRITSIKQLCSNHGSGVILEGKLFTRTRNLSGLLPCTLNEVAMVSTDWNLGREQLLRPRQIILTNANFPEYRQRMGGYRTTESSCRLVCRWSMSVSGTASPVQLNSGNRNHKNNGLLRRLREDEVDVRFRVPDRTLMAPYVTPPICLPNGSGEQQQVRKYTFGDAFCGAGGMSCGAKQAKFVNAWGFDHDKDAIATYGKCYPEAQSFHLSVDQFIALPSDYHVDVMHLSPPCQPHSPAHTTPGQFDEENEASGLCISDLLKKVKPRFATLEQTFGLTHRTLWFRAIINQFTSAGYSARWSVLQCVKYGVPQTRQRLFIMASCPGEQLLRFPKPTHWFPKPPPHPIRLKPARTLFDAIGNLRPDTNAHNPHDPALKFPKNMQISTKNVMDLPFSRTIMAGGNHNGVHPSGLRRFTLREIACIQTFPENYDFVGGTTNVKKQIGNAVPPRMGKVLMREVMRALEESDKKNAESSGIQPIDIEALDDPDQESLIVWVEDSDEDSPVRAGASPPQPTTGGPVQVIEIIDRSVRPIPAPPPERNPPQAIEWDPELSTGRPPMSPPPETDSLSVEERSDPDLEITRVRPAALPCGRRRGPPQFGLGLHATTPSPERGPQRVIASREPISPSPRAHPSHIFTGDRSKSSGLGDSGGQPAVTLPEKELLSIDAREESDSEIEITGEKVAEKPLQQPSRRSRGRRALGASYPLAPPAEQLQNVVLLDTPPPSAEQSRNVVTLDTPPGSPALSSSSPSIQQSSSASTQYQSPEVPPPSLPPGIELPQQDSSSEPDALAEPSASPARPPPAGIARRRRRPQTPVDDDDVLFVSETPSLSPLHLPRWDRYGQPRQRKKPRFVTAEDHSTEDAETASVRRSIEHIVID